MIITIKNLKMRTIIGINEEERAKKQELRVNLKIDADLRKAAESDNIQDTLDYDVIANTIIMHIEQASDFLIEKTAVRIRDILDNYNQIKSADIEVVKPGALPSAESVSVTLHYKR